MAEDASRNTQGVTCWDQKLTKNDLALAAGLLQPHGAGGSVLAMRGRGGRWHYCAISGKFYRYSQESAASPVPALAAADLKGI